MPTAQEEAALGATAGGTRDPDLDRGLLPKMLALCAMSRSSSGVMPEMSEGCLLHTPDCHQRNCFVVDGKKQETNTGGKATLPDHYRCSITCAFCGKRKHYEDECYHKQRLSAKLKNENGSGKGRGKGNADQGGGKGKSKGRGKGPDRGKGGRGGSDRKPHKGKNADKSGGSPNPKLGANSEPFGRQLNPGHKSLSRMHARKE